MREMINGGSEVEKIASSFYDEELEYHNFDHALKMLAVALDIADRCEKEGKKLIKDVIRYACLFHDAGYYENEKKAGFLIKEAYSADLARKELTKLNIEEDIIEQVVVAILATEKKADISDLSIEGMIVRVADLSGFAGNYNVFLLNNKKLKKEAEGICGYDISWEEWKIKTEEIMDFYLSQEIKLTKSYEDENGESIFHKKAKENLQRFLKENLEDKN